MNIRKLAASIAFIATSSSAFADSQTYPYVDFSSFQSSKSRAEVTAELESRQARMVRDHEYPDPGAGFVSTRSRAEVVAELREAVADGTYARSDFDSFPHMLRQYGGDTPSLARTSQAFDASK